MRTLARQYAKRPNILCIPRCENIFFCRAQLSHLWGKYSLLTYILLRRTMSHLHCFVTAGQKWCVLILPMKTSVFLQIYGKTIGAMHQKNTFMLSPHINLESVVSVQNDTLIIDAATFRMVLCISSAGNHPSELGTIVPFLPGWETNLAGSRAVALRHEVRTTVPAPGKL